VGRRVQVAIVAAVVAFGLRAGRADAGPRVEVRAVPDQVVPPELVDTLRIYLASAAEVEVGAPLAGATLDARIAEASAGLAHGALVTWLERAPGADGAYTVVVVGERDGRAAVEVGRLEGPDTTGISRLLALRIGAFLDDTLAAGPSSPLAPARPRRAIGPIAEVGGGGAGDGAGWHGEVALALGARRTGAHHRIEAVAIGRLGWPRRRRSDGGDVSLGLIDAALGGRFLVPIGPTWLGVAADVGARRIDATGMATDGSAGEVVRWMALVRVGLDARRELGRSLGVRLTAGIERGLGVERFTVRGAELAAVGTLAFTGSVALVVTLDRQ